MSAAASEKFELTLKALQGRWMHEPLNVLLKVRGMQVTFHSGEMYMLERASEKEFECFGFVAQEAQSTASEIVWQNPETGEVVKWHFEGEADAAYEVDPGNILTGKRSRRSVLDQPVLPDQPAKKPKLAESEVSGKKQKKTEKPAKAENPAKAEKDQKQYLAAVNKGIGNFKAWLASVSSRRNSAEQISGSLDLPEISDPHVARRMEEFVEGHAGFSGRASAGKLEISASSQGLRQALAKYGLAASRVDELAGTLAGEENQLDSAALLEIFAELGEISMNVETLKRTLLGAKVNKFSKSADAAVATAAKALVEKWKEIYRQEAMRSTATPSTSV